MWRKIVVLYAIFSAVFVSGNRIKRHLVFSKGSRLFFSVDVRDNLFIHSDLFANVFGFKIDWDLPTGITKDSKKSRLQRRDLYRGIESFLYHHNFNGTSCIRKFLCEASNNLSKSELFLAQLYEVIFTTKEEDILKTYNINDVWKDCRGVLTSTSEECPLALSSIFQENKPGFESAQA